MRFIYSSMLTTLLAGFILLSGCTVEEKWPLLSEKTWNAMTAEQITQLLKTNAVQIAAENGTTALHMTAAYCTDTSIINALISGGADVNAADTDGTTPLGIAVTNNNVAFVSLLIEAGAETTSLPEVSASASEITDAAITAKLQGASDDIDTESDEWIKTYVQAVRHGSAETIKSYLDAGFDPNFRNSSNITVLMEAAQYNASTNALETLIRAGAKIQARTRTGENVLMYAVKNPEPAITDLFLKMGVSVHAWDRQRETALYTAIKHPAPLAVIVNLITNYADVNARNSLGQTPLIAAVNEGLDSDYIALLLEHGANVHAWDDDANNALHHAAMHSPCDPETIRVLVEAGANVRATNNEGKTALDIFRKNTNTKQIKNDILKLLEE